MSTIPSLSASELLFFYLVSPFKIRQRETGYERALRYLYRDQSSGLAAV